MDGSKEGQTHSRVGSGTGASVSSKGKLDGSKEGQTHSRVGSGTGASVSSKEKLDGSKEGQTHSRVGSGTGASVSSKGKITSAGWLQGRSKPQQSMEWNQSLMLIPREKSPPLDDYKEGQTHSYIFGI